MAYQCKPSSATPHNSEAALDRPGCGSQQTLRRPHGNCRSAYWHGRFLNRFLNGNLELSAADRFNQVVREVATFGTVLNQVWIESTASNHGHILESTCPADLPASVKSIQHGHAEIKNDDVRPEFVKASKTISSRTASLCQVTKPLQHYDQAVGHIIVVIDDQHSKAMTFWHSLIKVLPKERHDSISSFSKTSSILGLPVEGAVAKTLNMLHAVCRAKKELDCRLTIVMDRYRRTPAQGRLPAGGSLWC